MLYKFNSMKKLIVTTLCLAGMAACSKPAKTAEEKTEPAPKAVGADKDSHGCKASAGQTWSELKQNCIQVFNEGFRLNPVDPPKDAAVISAFIILSTDQSKLELFLPDAAGQQSLILNKTGNDLYKNGQYKYDSNKSVLYINDTEKYTGNVE